MRIKRFNETVPSGWVNIKIDDQLYIRLSRYIPALDKLVGNNFKFNMMRKINALSKIKTHIKSKKITLQDKISLIVILQYLKEIKKHFNASSAGFLLESFLATLIHGELTNPYSPYDIIGTDPNMLNPLTFKASDSNNKSVKKYQIKFYNQKEDKDTFIKLSWDLSRRCDYYVLCLKQPDGNIDVCILNGFNKNSKQYILKFVQKNNRNNKEKTNIHLNKVKPIVENYTESDFVKVNGDQTYIVIKTSAISGLGDTDNIRMSLNVNDIDELINDCNEDIKKSLDEVYLTLSNLHYDIDSLVTGVDKDMSPILPDDACVNCNNSLNKLNQEINNLSNEIREL